MRILYILILVLFPVVLRAQIEKRQIGNVYYTVIPSNKADTKRNIAIAEALNEYIKDNAPIGFPPVLLYISDQNPKNPLSNLEHIHVFYERNERDFFPLLDPVFNVQEEHVVIKLALFDNHVEKSIVAVKHAIENISYLKCLEKCFYKKLQQGNLSDEDLERFRL